MKLSLLLFLGYFSCLAICAAPWQDRMVHADSLVAQHNYIKAAKRYERLLHNKSISDDTAFHIKAQLAKCYEQMGNTIKAESLYAQLENDSRMVDENIRFAYARMLQANGKGESAKEMFLKTNNPAAKDFAEIAEESYTDAFWDRDVSIDSLSMNTPASEFAPVMYKNGLVYTYNRKAARYEYASKHGRPYHSLMITGEENKGKPVKAKVFARKFKGHNPGMATFSRNGDVIFFTRNNYGAYRNNLCIVISYDTGRHWRRPQLLPFEKPQYNYAYPSLSADGKLLYFSSDMPGGAGGMDIWICQRTTDSTWSTPVNLGDTVNTAGDEVFPFIAGNGNLYFSSNGHAGMGGLDIFMAKTEGEKFVTVTNLEMPINSSKDDFGFFISPTDNTGYFSSNRTGNDDIYEFERLKKPITEHPILRAVELVGLPKFNEIKGLADASANINTADGKSVLHISDKDGYFYFKPDSGMLYQINVTKRDYDTASFNLAGAAKDEDNVTHQILLKPLPRLDTAVAPLSVNAVKKDTIGDLIKPVWHIVEQGESLAGIGKKFGSSADDMKIWNNLKGDDLSGIKAMIVGYQYDSEFKDLLAMKDLEKSGIDRNNRADILDKIKKYYASKMERDRSALYGTLYFDFNSKDLTLSITELNILSDFMKERRNVSIEVIGHTDSIGTNESNLQLSAERAKGVFDYLISKGLPSNRISYQYKGRSAPIASNTTPDGRAQNRRVEIYLKENN